MDRPLVVCVTTSAIPFFSVRLTQVIGFSCAPSPLGLYFGARHAQERCLSASARRWRCSFSLYSHPRLFIPSGDVDRTYVGMTRSAVRKETTAAPSPVAGSPWTRPSTTSPWSPGNFPACWLCCFSSPWDTSCSGRCAPNPGSWPSTQSTDTHLLPRHRSRSLKAVDSMCLLSSSYLPTMNVNACRRMRRRCALGSEQLEPRVGRRFEVFRHLRLCFISTYCTRQQTARDCFPPCRLPDSAVADWPVMTPLIQADVSQWAHFVTRRALFKINNSSRTLMTVNK